MSETIEQLKMQTGQLLCSTNLTNDEIYRLNCVAWELRETSTDWAIELSRKALNFAVSNADARGYAYAARNLGWLNHFKAKPEQATHFLMQSKNAFEKLVSPDYIGQASVLNGLAIMNIDFGDYPEALRIQNESLNLYAKAKEKSKLIIVYNNLGRIYHRLGDYAEALDFYSQTLPVIADSPAPALSGHLFTNLGNVLWKIGESEKAIQYLNLAGNNSTVVERTPFHQGAALAYLGAAYQSRQDYGKALENYLLSLKFAHHHQNYETEIEAQACLGNLYTEMSDLTAALTSLLPALSMARSRSSRFLESKTLFFIGIAYKQLGDVPQTIEMLENALALSEKMAAKEIQYKSHFYLSEVYQQTGKMATALHHHQVFHRIWNEVYGFSNSRKIQKLLFERNFKLFTSKERLLTLNALNKFGATAHRAEELTLPPQMLTQAVEFIERNLESEIGLTEIAAQVGMSKDYFSKLFKRSTGKTPYQYLIARRIHRAKRLLQSTNLPLSEIALQAGFSSQSHLTMQFRLTTGTTPRRFRDSP